MSIRFIIGRAGSGKSQRCLKEISDQLKSQPEGRPLILLVPEQATFQAEHALVSMPELGGMIRAQVLSFHRLAWRVMQEQGGTARPPIDDTGKKLLLYSILHKRKDELRLFHNSAEQMGFVDRVNELFTEFKRYCVSAEQLEEHRNRRASQLGESRLLGDKLHDLRLLYKDFEQELSRQYLDGEDYLALLAEQIPFSAYLQQATIWIDGFHGFTPQEFAVLERLMEFSQQVSITLCLDRAWQAGDEPDELDVFHPTARTMIRLQEIVERLGNQEVETVVVAAEHSPRFVESPVLRHLEKAFEHRISGGKHAFGRVDADNDQLRNGIQDERLIQRTVEEQLIIKEAVNRRAEVEGAVRNILQLVREDRVRYRNIAIMVRNMESYEDLLRSALTDCGIPHFFDQKRTVLHHPLVEFIRSAIEIVQHNWHYDAVFRCVKTDLLLPYPIQNEQRMMFDRLENYVLAFGIRGTRWTDNKPWTYRLKAGLDATTTSQSAEAAEEKFLEQIHISRQWIVKPLHAFALRLKSARTIKDQTAALYQLLLDVQAADKLDAWSVGALQTGKPEKAREHSQLWNKIMDMLDQLVETMGDEVVAFELFAGLVDTGLESMKLGLVPPSMDQVLIGSMDRTRSSGIEYAYLLGVNDGVIPAQMQENGVLSEGERELLQQTGLPMAEGSERKLLDEAFVIYTSLTVPSRRLWLSYPLADEEGKMLLPSELIRQIRSLFPAVKPALLFVEPTAEMEEIQQSDYIAHPSQALSYLAVRMKHWMHGGRMADLWWEAYNWYVARPEWSFKLQSLVNGLLYTNRETSLGLATSKLLYGKHLRASVSRMERYVACPFSHFASHGLRLQERRVYKLEAPDIGQLFHAALSEFAQQLQVEQVDWGSLSNEACMERSAQVVETLAPRLQGEILLSSSRYQYIARKLKQVVGKTAIVLSEHARRGEFVPLRLEVDFGPGKELPPLMFELENGCTMEIIGRIDRVDCAEGEKGVLLRVIDYKSSQTNLSLSEVYHGLSLQMLTYLDVILTHAEEWLGIEALPAGVLYFHVHNPMLQVANSLAPEEVEKELRKRFKMKGLVTADPDVAQRMDDYFKHSSGHSQLLPLAIKKDGSFYSSSSVATENQWNTLRNYVRQQIKQIGTAITEGHVEIAPYRIGKKIACQQCSYQSVCQIDPLFEGNEIRVLRQRSKEQVWHDMELVVN
ncbi:helicase-exonuclease AddAB subunit AddB [Paenibacillus eucommiae]|uniref:ATP-dependent helicase/deoxyribonuclease subunit B n=1 Tax=Paenibacillus eucommiae TaxID=1355755 RepID=A0ABS4J0K6_9BACL|nr:helicase-exonuclease AddAB subunit AddB [Paenibacillus eucommiae]MBP1992860.1 ATP-dependent helicase/nuclease subunit B [Paenibacillus eucommiae]